MSRLAQQVAFNGTGKHAATSVKEVASDLRVLDVGRPGTAPDIQLAPVEAAEELVLLRAENAELRGRVEQNEQLMQAAVASEEVWLERQKEYEILLEEKSDVIRDLHQKINALQEGSAGQNFARAEELNQVKNQLEARQAQLTEDEASLTTQMRAMEMALSRDRAELARQRNDVLRLQAEINREIEMASRDSGLRDRLASLRNRNPEVRNHPEVRRAPKTEVCIELPPLPALPLTAPPARPGAPSRPQAAAPLHQAAPTSPAAASPPQAEPAPAKKSFLRRLFGF